jgi:putative membrane protein
MRRRAIDVREATRREIGWRTSENMVYTSLRLLLLPHHALFVEVTTEEKNGMEWLIGFIAYFLVAALVIWLVSRLGLGLTVDGFVGAIIAALVIAVVTSLIMWFLGLLGITLGGGWWGALMALIVSAVILMFSDRFVPGMKVNGFGGAIVAALGIGVVTWAVQWFLGLFGL